RPPARRRVAHRDLDLDGPLGPGRVEDGTRRRRPAAAGPPAVDAPRLPRGGEDQEERDRPEEGVAAVEDQGIAVVDRDETDEGARGARPREAADGETQGGEHRGREDQGHPAVPPWQRLEDV